MGLGFELVLAKQHCTTWASPWFSCTARTLTCLDSNYKPCLLYGIQQYKQLWCFFSLVLWESLCLRNPCGLTRIWAEFILRFGGSSFGSWLLEFLLTVSSCSAIPKFYPLAPNASKTSALFCSLTVCMLYVPRWSKLVNFSSSSVFLLSSSV